MNGDESNNDCESVTLCERDQVCCVLTLLIAFELNKTSVLDQTPDQVEDEEGTVHSRGDDPLPVDLIETRSSDLITQSTSATVQEQQQILTAKPPSAPHLNEYRRGIAVLAPH
jgi:hypothetical protein